MLQLFNQYSRNRMAWVFLLLISLCFELTALYFQYINNIKPCVLCIYQRTALLGIILAAIIGLITPQNVFFRLIAILLWIYCGVKGFFIAYEQALLQFDPGIFHFCPLQPDFPGWLPLHRLVPFFFNSYGNCSQKVWQFLTLEMSQWMLLIFAFYSIIGLVVLIAQPVQLPRTARWRN